MRAKTFPIGPVNNNESAIANQLFFYVHQPFAANNKGLNITIAGQSNNIAINTNSNNTFSYAILNQQYNDNNSPTNYTIAWKDKDNSTILKQQQVNLSRKVDNYFVMSIFFCYN